MDKLLELLKADYPAIDFTKEKKLISGGLIDSVDVVTIISEIEDEFHINVTMEYIKPENFDSLESIWKMIEELKQVNE